MAKLGLLAHPVKAINLVVARRKGFRISSHFTRGGFAIRQSNTAYSLGSVIKTARKSKKLTQEELAARLDISKRYLQAIENSGNIPSYSLLAKIVDVLTISAEIVFRPEKVEVQCLGRQLE